MYQVHRKPFMKRNICKQHLQPTFLILLWLKEQTRQSSKMVSIDDKRSSTETFVTPILQHHFNHVCSNQSTYSPQHLISMEFFPSVFNHGNRMTTPTSSQHNMSNDQQSTAPIETSKYQPCHPVHSTKKRDILQQHCDNTPTYHTGYGHRFRDDTPWKTTSVFAMKATNINLSPRQVKEQTRHSTEELQRRNSHQV